MEYERSGSTICDVYRVDSDLPKYSSHEIAPETSLDNNKMKTK